MKTKILTTGLSGLVGSRIAELLSGQYDFDNLGLSSGVDILNRPNLEARIHSSTADTFIHLAAFTDVNQAWEQKGNQNGICYRVNVIGTKNVAEICRRTGKHLIYFSTDFVFDGSKTSPYAETDQPNPIEWYGQTKYEGEKIIGSFGFTTVRIAYPFRAKFEPKLDFVRKLIENLKSGKQVNLFGDNVITPTFIDDIAPGLDQIIQTKPGGIFHLVGSTALSIHDLALKVAKEFNLDQKLINKTSLAEYIKNNPNSRPFQPYLALSNEKAKKELNIQMQSIDNTLTQLHQQMIQ
jgi:dTDP-4-dehydrorhamnose reductase